MSAIATLKMAYQKTLPDFRIVRLKPLEIIDALVEHGWRLQLDGGTPGSAWVWDGVQQRDEVRGTTEQLRDAICRWQWDHNVIGVQIWWQGLEIGGSLYLYQREQELVLGMMTTGTWKTLEPYEGYTDDAWFLPKFIKPLESLDAGVSEVTSHFHW